MSQQSTRSEQVVERYKRHKLAASALRRIHETIAGFEQDRADDARYARIGLVVVLVLFGIAALYLYGTR